MDTLKSLLSISPEAAAEFRKMERRNAERAERRAAGADVRIAKAEAKRARKAARRVELAREGNGG